MFDISDCMENTYYHLGRSNLIVCLTSEFSEKVERGKGIHNKQTEWNKHNKILEDLEDFGKFRKIFENRNLNLEGVFKHMYYYMFNKI